MENKNVLDDETIKKLKSKFRRATFDNLFDMLNWGHYADYDQVVTFLKNNVCSFEQFVDKFADIVHIDDPKGGSCLYALLSDNEDLFARLLEENLLTKNGLQHLIDRAERECFSYMGPPYVEEELTKVLIYLCMQYPTTMKTDFLSDKDLAQSFNDLLREHGQKCEQLSDRYVEDVFELIENRIAQLRADGNLSETGDFWERKFCVEAPLDYFPSEQRLELSNLAQQSETAKKLLDHLAATGLITQYKFEELKELLTVPEKNIKTKKLK